MYKIFNDVTLSVCVFVHVVCEQVLVSEKLELVDEYYFALVLDRSFMVGKNPSFYIYLMLFLSVLSW